MLAAYKNLGLSMKISAAVATIATQQSAGKLKASNVNHPD
jgi:hypothetical protein